MERFLMRILSNAMLAGVFSGTLAAQEPCKAGGILREGVLTSNCFALFNKCSPMLLNAEVDTDDAAASIGLTEERIQTLAESRLRAARLFIDAAALKEEGFSILSRGFSSSDRSAADNAALDRLNRVAHLSVSAGVVGPAFSYSVKFRKKLHDRVSDQTEPATTWTIGKYGTHGGDAGYILQDLSESMDKFLVEYLRVNESACGP